MRHHTVVLSCLPHVCHHLILLLLFRQACLLNPVKSSLNELLHACSDLKYLHRAILNFIADIRLASHKPHVLQIIVQNGRTKVQVENHSHIYHRYVVGQMLSSSIDRQALESKICGQNA